MTTHEARYDLATAAYDRDGTGVVPRRTILVCTSRRSGSTLLGEALHRAGGLGCPLEYLHRGFRPGLQARWGTSELAGYVAALYRHRTDPTGTLSVKLFWPDVMEVCAERYPCDAFLFTADLTADPKLRTRAFARVADLLCELFPDPTYLFLWRRDLLRQAISDCRAARSNRWRSLDPPAPDGISDIDPEAIAASIARFSHQRQQWRDWFDDQRHSPVETVFEDLVSDYAATVRRLVVRLGGLDPDAAAAPPRLRRQSDGSSERLAARFLTTTGGRRPLL